MLPKIYATSATRAAIRTSVVTIVTSTERADGALVQIHQGHTENIQPLANTSYIDRALSHIHFSPRSLRKVRISQPSTLRYSLGSCLMSNTSSTRAAIRTSAITIVISTERVEQTRIHYTDNQHQECHHSREDVIRYWYSFKVAEPLAKDLKNAVLADLRKLWYFDRECSHREQMKYEWSTVDSLRMV